MANEVRLIDANVVEAALLDFRDIMCDTEPDDVSEECTYNVIMDCIRTMNAAPTVDPESLRPKGHWEIHCYSTYDSWTMEADESFYLECSECKRQVWDVDQLAAMNEDIRKLTEQYPYCHCGCKMEG